MSQSPHEDDTDRELGFELPAPVHTSTRRLALVTLITCALLGAVFFAGLWPKLTARAALEDDTRTAAQAPLRIEVITPRKLDEVRSLKLPGSVHPFAETTLYSRANGYVRAFHKDLGDHVKSGDLLVEIDTPELDQQLVQARAQLLQVEAALAQAAANKHLAHVTLERYRALRPAGVTSQQELDQYAAQVELNDANEKAAQAAVEVQRAEQARLTRLKAFARVTAPFAGLVTARNVEVGALVAAGNSMPLYVLSANDPVRVFVDVPQDMAPSVRVGGQASIKVREFPDREFKGAIARSQGALSASTRTMRAEVYVPNADGALLAGMYAEASLDLNRPHAVYEVPATALISNAAGLSLASVTPQGTIKILPIVIEHDAGATIQIASGLTGNERIARIGNLNLNAGERVQAVNASIAEQ
jgi:membrane fusion protein (multidrug efflux system)